MLKMAGMAGVALLVAGVAGGCWPRENVMARSRALVLTRTYDRRGPAVFVETRAGRVRDAAGQMLSVPMLLGADGYWTRSGPEYITRERLENTRVLVIDRDVEALGGRTTTLVSRWIESGGSVLVLARGQGPEVRTERGLGRAAVIDPSAFAAADFVGRLQAAMHWLARFTDYR